MNILMLNRIIPVIVVCTGQILLSAENGLQFPHDAFIPDLKLRGGRVLLSGGIHPIWEASLIKTELCKQAEAGKTLEDKARIKVKISYIDALIKEWYARRASAATQISPRRFYDDLVEKILTAETDEFTVHTPFAFLDKIENELKR